MFTPCAHIISKFEIRLRDPRKEQGFFKSMRELVTILFGVVFGVGLSELGNFTSNYDLSVLILAYFAVVFSWWGYHWGIVVGSPETNILNYLLDCCLVTLYWLLINIRSPLENVLFLYFLMFSLYFFWEVIRFCKKERSLTDRSRICKALKINLIFMLIIEILYLTQCLSMWIRNSVPNSYIVVLLFILVFVYRIFIQFIYSPEAKTDSNAAPVQDYVALIKSAESVAENAKVDHSHFMVGAAILSDTGNIYVGCNVEFDNYSNTIHAEEAALSALVSAGENHPLAIAIFTFGDTIYFPCGMCRQSLYELGGPDLEIISSSSNTREVKRGKMGDLLPEGFRFGS